MNLKILLDRDVFARRQICEPAIQIKEVDFGEFKQIIELQGWRRKHQLGRNKDEELQIRAIGTIGRLARKQQLELCTYQELFFEACFASTNSFPKIGDLLRDCKIQKVPAAIERSFFSGTEFSEYAKKGSKLEFYRQLLETPLEEIESLAPKFWRSLPTESQNGLRSIARYRELCSFLPEKHFPDAFHLWTAELNRIGVFLTCDQKFINALKMSSGLVLKSDPVRPTVFLKQIGIADLDPLPVQDLEWHSDLEHW